MSSEPLVHSHVADGLPPDHSLAHELVRCDRCYALLHSRRNSCLRTWIESGRGNFCVGCFVLAAGGLAADTERGLGGVDCLTAEFGLRQKAPA